MAFIESVGITTLSDLTDAIRIAELGAIINDTFAGLIIKETVVEKEMTKSELRIYEQCCNPKKWEDFSAKQRCIKKQQFNAIIQKYGRNQWKKNVAKMINDKWKMLLVI